MIAQLEKAGYSVQQDGKARYYHGMVRLMGGLGELHFLKASYMLQLFSHAKLRTGKSYTLRTIAKIADPREAYPHFITTMQMLVSKQVFLRGYVLRCPVCDLETWYDFRNVDDLTHCAGCYQSFALPLELDFAYKLNRLVMMALNQGALTVYLTLLALPDIAAWDVCYRVKRDGQETELDLLVQCSDGRLILAECKDNLETNLQLKTQLQRIIKVGQRINADEVLFATLYEGALPELPVKVMNRTTLTSARKP